MAPATGDWVAVVDDPELGPDDRPGVGAEPTRCRAEIPSEAVVEQVLVANVDLVLIVHGLDQTPAARGAWNVSWWSAWDSGAEVAVVLTKADRNVADGSGR